MNKLLQYLLLVVSLAILPVHAAAPDSSDKPFAEHKLVLQLSDGDRLKQQDVLNVASNVVKHYGQDQVDIEIVAFGPGLKLLFRENDNAARIGRLAEDTGIRFSACNNTLHSIRKKTGKEPVLNPVSQRVATGVARIMELVEQGYVLVRP